MASVVREKRKDLSSVRIEDDTSVGRSYSKKGRLQKGIGAARRLLRTRSWNPPELEMKHASMSLTNLAKSSRADVLAYFNDTWHTTDLLFGALRDDSVYFDMPDRLRRPLIFYFGHTAAVYCNKLQLAGLCDHVNLHFQKVFETGVDEMSWDDMDEMQDEDFAWPTMPETIDFRNVVYKMIVDLIENKMPSPDKEPITKESPFWALFMGMEHEHIHLETSSVLFRQLPIDSVITPKTWRYAPTTNATPESTPKNKLIGVDDKSVAVLGRPNDYPSFGWDVQYGKRVVEVPQFEASQFLVSNAEFLPFVLAGGYKMKKYWISPTGDDEGWRWVTFRNATHPSFWVATKDMPEFFGGKPDYPYQKDDGHPKAGSGKDFKLRQMFDIVDMPWDHPVEVNFLEAHAFLAWKTEQEGGCATYRVPTEAEWHTMRAHPSAHLETRLPGAASPEGADGGSGCGGGGGGGGGATAAAKKPVIAGSIGAESSVRPEIAKIRGGLSNAAHGDTTGLTDVEKVDITMRPEVPFNLNLRYGSASPVDLFKPSATGFYDTHGNVWQWAEDHFAPLPGFEIHYLYDDFSTPCFDGWHSAMYGGSFISCGELASSFARYHFRRHFFQHLGFRYVRVPKEREEAWPGEATANNLWEGQGVLSTVVTDDFGKRPEKFPYPVELGELEQALEYGRKLASFAEVAYKAKAGGITEGNNVLHLGCGVGGVSLELCRRFHRVLAVDSKEVLITTARILQHHGQLEYQRTSEGVLTSTAHVTTPEGVDRSRVKYVHSDVSDLSSDVTIEGPFDVVIIDNFLTKILQPLGIVKTLPALVKPGGTLIVACDNDWNPDITPRNAWLGGFNMNGEAKTTLDMLKYNLKKAFDFEKAEDIPRMSRMHARKFIVNVMEVSAWVRKD